jgi:hypothetical protein
VVVGDAEPFGAPPCRRGETSPRLSSLTKRMWRTASITESIESGGKED